MTFKTKRFLDRIIQTGNAGVFWEDLSQGDRDRCEHLLQLGKVEKQPGVWSGVWWIKAKKLPDGHGRYS